MALLPFHKYFHFKAFDPLIKKKNVHMSRTDHSNKRREIAFLSGRRTSHRSLLADTVHTPSTRQPRLSPLLCPVILRKIKPTSTPGVPFPSIYLSIIRS